jgi:hypothetical protein
MIEAFKESPPERTLDFGCGVRFSCSVRVHFFFDAMIDRLLGDQRR